MGRSQSTGPFALGTVFCVATSYLASTHVRLNPDIFLVFLSANHTVSFGHKFFQQGQIFVSQKIFLAKDQQWIQENSVLQWGIEP